MIPWAQWVGFQPSISVGDFVRRKETERPRMRVLEIADGQARCSWWESADRRGRWVEWFAVDQLEAWE